MTSPWGALEYDRHRTAYLPPLGPKDVEFRLRDTRHLKGTTPQVAAAPPSHLGLAIGTGRDGETPLLRVRDEAGELYHLRLDGTLNLEVLDPRMCVGHHDETGPVPCPHKAAADRFDQCPACHPLPERDCVFNPRCADCALDFCRGSHRLYLAFYGELPKVGMTRAARGDARLIEQGADAFAVLTTAPDRAEARRLEDLVTSRLDIPQARRAEELLTRAARTTPWTAIENTYARLLPRLSDLLGVAPGPLERIDDHTGTFPLPSVPTLAGVVGHHAGQVLGVKGRHLFYRVPHPDPEKEAQATIWALNLGAVVTHLVRFDPEGAAPA